MKMVMILCLLLFFMGLTVLSHADTYEPIAHCYKPSKPLMFASSHYKNRYTQDVEVYRICLKTFIEHQENAAKMHQEAAKNALKTWNDFASQQ